MSEQTITEKLTEKISNTISETITNIFKKSDLSNKAYNFQLLLGISIIIPTAIGLLGYFGYNNLMYENEKIQDKIQYDIMYYYLNNTRFSQKINENIYILNEKIKFLEKELKEQLEKQDVALKTISEMPLLNICKDKPISNCSSSISILMEDSPRKPVLHIETDFSQNNEQQIELKDPKNMEDDELIDESYDSIPLSNVKKVTGIKSFIWFGGN